jgi:hypothetical protein
MLRTCRSYESDELVLLRRIWEDAVNSLPVQQRTQTALQIIAKRILDCAATGERDPVELRIAAMRDFTSSEHRLAG